MSKARKADLSWGLKAGAFTGAFLALVPLPYALPWFLWQTVTGDRDVAELLPLLWQYPLLIVVCMCLGAIGGLIVGAIRDRAKEGASGAALAGFLVGLVIQPLVGVGMIVLEGERWPSFVFWLATFLAGGVVGGAFGVAAWLGERNYRARDDGEIKRSIGAIPTPSPESLQVVDDIVEQE